MTYFRPHDAGIDSETEKACKRLGRLLDALGDEINSNICSGDITQELSTFRYEVIQKLRADGWSVRTTDDGFVVTPAN